MTSFIYFFVIRDFGQNIQTEYATKDGSTTKISAFDTGGSKSGLHELKCYLQTEKAKQYQNMFYPIIVTFQ